MEIRQLRCFVAVAEELHFARAAARLGVAQPAVSQQLARLERELGLSLLTRSPRRVALTADGVQLLAEARAALAAVDRVRDVAEELATGRTGALRIGTSPGLGRRLAHGLATLRELAPDVELILVDGPARAHAAAVASGELRAALVRTAPPPRAGVHAVRLGEDPLSAVLPRTHPAAAAPAVRVRELADLRLRLPPRDGDPVLHDAVLARCADEEAAVARGRDVTSVDDAVLEIGTGTPAWTVVHSERTEVDRCASETYRGPRAAVRPFDPPLGVPVHMLLPIRWAATCRDALVDAFR
ncbi:LysR family transcriptional regulator [Streptomyces lasiicapitis]|uniref:LysR family transcriptional regulator n=1 Tax=Streptomyces lasiicapitis TaxID=1923961 RepID=UPI0036618AFF